MRTPPKLGWSRGGVRSTKKRAKSLKQCKIGPRLLFRTNRNSHTRFRLVPASVTLDDLERLKRHPCRNKRNLWVQQKNFKEDRPTVCVTLCICVSGENQHVSSMLQSCLTYGTEVVTVEVYDILHWSCTVDCGLLGKFVFFIPASCRCFPRSRWCTRYSTLECCIVCRYVM